MDKGTESERYVRDQSQNAINKMDKFKNGNNYFQIEISLFKL